jgi:predicted DNA-binding antitoxin AbrB/MazE fold protein
MTIEAPYRDGAFYPVHLITLPENTRVEVSVAPLREEKAQTPLTSPKITSEEFRARIAKHAVSVGALPSDF